MKNPFKGVLTLVKQLKSYLRDEFYPIVVSSNSLLAESHKIRHKVYCEEYKFEQESHTQKEHDKYDLHAIHLLVCNKSNNQMVGSVRLVLNQGSDGLTRNLPIENYLNCLDDPVLFHKLNSDHVFVAEVSRLCILGHARNKERIIAGVNSGLNTSSAALISLYMGLFVVAKHYNIRYLFAVVQPRLYNSMRKLRIPVETIGREIELKGYRVPIIIPVDKIEGAIPVFLRSKYKRIEGAIVKDIPPLSKLQDINLAP